MSRLELAVLSSGQAEQAPGFTAEQARGRSEAAGFNHHLVKPIHFDTLLALMNRPKAGS